VREGPAQCQTFTLCEESRNIQGAMASQVECSFVRLSNSAFPPVVKVA